MDSGTLIWTALSSTAAKARQVSREELRTNSAVKIALS